MTIQFLSSDKTTLLQGRWQAPQTAAKPVAVLAHHYPPMSNMDHRAIFATAKALRAAGWGVLRYNSRGVGESAGEFSGGAGEDHDLDGAIHEARQRAPFAPIALVGWSFGAERVLRAMARNNGIAATVAITPDPQALFAVKGIAHGPLAVIVAERDQYFDLIETRTAWEQVSEPKTWHILKWADHFYVTREEEVADWTVAWLTTAIQH